MKFKIIYIKDSVGNNYLGVNIYRDTVSPFLDQFKEIIGDDYDEYVKYQQERDHGHHHITVINVMEFNKLSKEMGVDKFVNSLESVFDFDFTDIKLMGVGTAEKSGNRTYFVVVNSDQLQEVRKKYNLPEQDFHITIGFKYKDVFGVRKNQVMTIGDPFLKLLKKKYYNDNETFDFIRDIDNFDMDIDEDIEPIKIEDTNATFRCGENNYFTVALIGDDLRIAAKWQDTEKKPILANTLISKKLKDI
jgi:uncharacterized protein YaaQ